MSNRMKRLGGYSANFLEKPSRSHSLLSLLPRNEGKWQNALKISEMKAETVQQLTKIEDNFSFL